MVVILIVTRMITTVAGERNANIMSMIAILSQVHACLAWNKHENISMNVALFEYQQ